MPLEELAEIEGFDEEVANELRLRAQGWLEEQAKKLDERRRELGVEDSLAQLQGLSPALVVTLGEKGVKTLDDLGDLASDELIELLGEDVLDPDEANAVIMAARAHWFEGEETPAAENDAAGDEAAETEESAG